MGERITLSIDFDPQTGRVNVLGPIQDKLLSLGLLELAKATVLAFRAEREGVLLARGPVPAGGLQ